MDILTFLDLYIVCVLGLMTMSVFTLVPQYWTSESEERSYILYRPLLTYGSHVDRTL